MSPAAALQSPVFLFYSALAVGVLVVAGADLAVMKWGLRKNVGHAWAAYCGWLLIVPLMLLAFFLGREAVIVVVTVVAVLGFREFALASGLSADRLMTGVVYLAIGAAGMICLAARSANGNSAWYDLFTALPVFAIALILAVPVVRDRARDQLRMLGLAVLGFMYFGWMFGHLALLANSAAAYGYLGFLVLAVALNDVAAFVCGRFFGRHALCSNISPNKTREGAVGALAVSLLLPWALRPTLPHFEARDCLVAGLIVGVGAQVGDLVVSVMKRDLGVKDMGALIPGHGGILDRTDSLVYVAPLFVQYVRYRFGLDPMQ